MGPTLVLRLVFSGYGGQGRQEAGLVRTGRPLGSVVGSIAPSLFGPIYETGVELEVRETGSLGVKGLQQLLALGR